MHLGNFSVSLAVKDLQASIKFYKTLGFEQVSGDESQNWVVLKNGYARIGLFQGMLEDNMMTFNPRWDDNGTEAEGTDVREIATALKEAGLELEQENTASESGPGYFFVKDPDGNTILIDQHV
ncbi:VOC family protein [Macrococcus sp. DPC7161]|uniref:VOC family protein n=1 Tax=Macrococcus sp. DPC7161 TaxID=2507060 RepID=UPI00100A7493|nr:VOC family protein [Macrococcus sp. DPC7161]RXK17293.1 VOC family protein [Macrococcus sp. DPC7161]